MILWRCPGCDDRIETFDGARGVTHRCPARRGNPVVDYVKDEPLAKTASSLAKTASSGA